MVRSEPLYHWFLLSLASVAMTTTNVEPNIYAHMTEILQRQADISFHFHIHIEPAQQYTQLGAKSS